MEGQIYKRKKMTKIVKITSTGIIDDKRGYVPLCEDAFNLLRDYFKIPPERLKKRLPHVRSSTTRYLMKLVIDNQKGKDADVIIESQIRAILTDVIQDKLGHSPIFSAINAKVICNKRQLFHRSARASRLSLQPCGYQSVRTWGAYLPKHCKQLFMMPKTKKA